MESAPAAVLLAEGLEGDCVRAKGFDIDDALGLLEGGGGRAGARRSDMDMLRSRSSFGSEVGVVLNGSVASVTVVVAVVVAVVVCDAVVSEVVVEVFALFVANAVASVRVSDLDSGPCAREDDESPLGICTLASVADSLQGSP